MFAAFGIQHVIRMPQIVICSLLRSIAFFHIISQTAQFSKKKKNVIECKMCVLISSTTFVWNISHSKKNWARYDKKMSVVFV